MPDMKVDTSFSPPVQPTYPNTVTYNTLSGVMRIISESPTGYLHDISKQEWEIVTSRVVWIADRKATARRVLETIVFGTLDLLGLARYEVPVEYLAGVIALTCAPVNYLVACHLMSGYVSHRVDDMSMDDVDHIAPVQPRQLFAYVCQASFLAPTYLDTFRTNVGSIPKI